MTSLEYSPLTQTRCSLCSKYDRKHETDGDLAVYRDLFANKMSCSTKSKAFLRSRKTIPTTCELLILESQLSHSLAKAV